MSDYSGHEVPLVPGTLRGYRSWTIDSNGFLHPINPWPNSAWTNGINESVCHGDHGRSDMDRCGSSPGKNCTCGFYATHIPFYATHIPLPWRGSVIGVIEASGRVIIGTQGFRAQKARIVAVVDPVAQHRWTAHGRAMLLDNYPDVDWFQDPERMWEKYPPQDLSEIVDLQAMKEEEDRKMQELRKYYERLTVFQIPMSEVLRALQGS